MRIRLAIPDHLVTPQSLEAALEATMLANQEAIVRGEVPDIREAISRGVKWKPEPFRDGEHFDLAEEVIRRGWGDCDDLAPALAASMRASGEDEGAVPRVYQSGPGRWHVVVETSDGEILDPSRWAGMGKKSSVSGSGYGVGPAIARPLAHPGRGALAVMPHAGQYWCRCDIPYPGTAQHLASHARARDPETAIERAINGAMACGEALDVGDDELDGLELVGTLMLGDDDEIEEVGFLPALAALAPAGISLAKGLFGKKKKRTPPAATQHPGGAVSVPVKKHHRKHGGRDNMHMMLSYYPAHAQGPVVMRF